ncbi:MAG: NADPH:quinone oxidoreductase family protein [Deltaproteobacteria bacterium]|nr:NADPH:quinone oxidoreductase family protein [Deltaproteobacteria bacterium]MBW2418964.1 NADPH:quinone oxidoreductase family protein [Deltaproteobacteria bacterium]
MRAIVCNELGPPEKLGLEERESLAPGPGQVRIAVRACGVNFVDALFVQGRYQVRIEPPFVPGSEVAGEIAAVGEGVGVGVGVGVGEGVSHPAVGDRVLAMTGLNGFAEEVIAEADAAIPIPEGLDMAQAAAFTQSYATALYGLVHRGSLQAGETLLVLGAAGGVGLAAIDVAKAIGARVIAAASSDEKLELCRTAGADLSIDYASEDLKLRAKELSGGAVDMVYDPVGGDYAEPALRALSPGGRYLVIGFASGEIPRVPFNLMLLKSCQVVGVDWGGSARRDPTLNERLRAELSTLLVEGRLKPQPPKTYPLEEAGRALRDLLDRRLAGKAVLIP